MGKVDNVQERIKANLEAMKEQEKWEKANKCKDKRII